MNAKWMALAAIALSTLFSYPSYGFESAFEGRTDSVSVEVSPGIIYSQEISTGDAPLILNALTVDLRKRGVRIAAGQANGIVSIKNPNSGRQSISDIARQQHAAAAVNADFFPYTGDPLGLEIRNGELLSESMDYRVCMGISKGKPKFEVLTTLGSWSSGNLEGRLQGINRLPGVSEVTVLTPSFFFEAALPRDIELIPLTGMNLPFRVSKEIEGIAQESFILKAGELLPRCRKNSAYLAIGSKADTALRELGAPGEKVSLLFDLTATGDPPLSGKYSSDSSKSAKSHTILWNEMQEAVSGGPWLVKKGKLYVDSEAEGFDKLSFSELRHPRTAVGITANQRLLLVTVDGRSKWSRGASLMEMAKIMLRLGAVDAINLDGGGSTTMTVKNSVVNSPSDGKERPVANGLLVFSSSTNFNELSNVQKEERIVRAGVPAEIELELPPSERKSLVWGTADGFGFVSQKGIFVCDKPGAGQIFAISSRRIYTFPVKVLP